MTKNKYLDESVNLIEEARESCAIEDIYVSDDDMFNYINYPHTISNNATQLFSNYLDAMVEMFNEIKKEPWFSIKMILKAHKSLFINSDYEGNPGQFRDSMVRIGRFIPPAPYTIVNSMEMLVQSMNSGLPMNITEIGILHAQFEFIHPFSDGNGRLGRILIMIMLARNCIIKSLNIAPSKLFNKDRGRYLQELDRVSLHNCMRNYAIEGFESWNTYFSKIIEDSLSDTDLNKQIIIS